jgi:hypothetical protein
MACVCGDETEECGEFVCGHCGQIVPWCCGASDDTPDLCDDCADDPSAVSMDGPEVMPWD